MRFLVCVILFHIPFLAISQRIKNYTLYYSGTTVTARFTVAAGSICDGFLLLHSIDSVNYSVVYDYPGICGVPGDDLSFSADHTNATTNRYNYYKIQLSTVETSEKRKIFVPDPTGPELIIFPNPASNKLNLRILHDENSLFRAHIYDYSGKEVLAQELSFNNGQSTIFVDYLVNGIYVFKIENNVNTFSTKLVVFR